MRILAWTEQGIYIVISSIISSKSSGVSSRVVRLQNIDKLQGEIIFIESSKCCERNNCQSESVHQCVKTGT